MNIPVDKFTGRINYSKIHRDDQMPNLLAVQLESYNDFLQTDVSLDKRKNVGLESVFRSIFPIESTRGHLVVEYQSYALGEPKYGIEECQERGLTFAAPLKVKMQLVVKDEDDAGSTEELQIRDI
ncbi:hypothetical protein KKA85_09725, partial [bacterium]|nr:hypothetical protein [bacterium]